MDKHDLLRSFSKVHGKSIRLLEALDAQRQQDFAVVQQAVSDFMNKTPVGGSQQGLGNRQNLTLTRTSRQGFQVLGAGGPGGTLKFKDFSKFNVRSAATSNSNAAQLLGAWIPKEEDPEQVEKQQQQKDVITQQTDLTPEQADAILKDEARQKTLDSEMNKRHPEDVAKILDNVTRFEQTLNGLICDEQNKVNKKYLKAVASVDSNVDPKNPKWQFCREHLRYLIGGNLGNVEQSLVNAMPNLRYDGATKKYVVGSEDQDPDKSIMISEALNTLAQAADGDEAAKEEACNKFKVTEGGGLKGVTVYTELDAKGKGQEGRVFNRPAAARSLIGLMKMAGCSTRSVSARKAIGDGTGTGRESNIRGQMGELAKIAVVDVLNYVRGKGTDGSKERIELALGSLKEVYESLESLDEAREDWIARAQNSIPTEEEQAALEIMNSISGDPEKKKRFVAAIFATAASTVRLRKPLVSVQVGQQVGGGQKQDVLECWSTPEEALKGLRSSESFEVDGQQQSRLTEDNVIPMKASEIFVDDPDLLKRYIKANIIKDKDQTLYVSEISLKTLLSLSAAKKGETTPEAVAGPIRDPNTTDGRAVNFFSKVSPELHKGIRDIQSQSDAILEGVTKLQTKVKVGKSDVNSLEVYTNSVIDYLRKNKTFKDIANDEDLKDLEDYISKIKERPDDPKFQAKVKDKLFKITLQTRITNLANGSPKQAKAAALYSLAVFNQAGGSRSDGTIFQVDALDELASYISTQNGEMNSALDSILSGDGKWEFSPSKGSLKFVRSNDPNRTILVKYDKGKWFAYRSATSIRAASTRKDARAIASKISGESKKEESLMWQTLDKLQEALGVLKEKVIVMDTH